MIKEFSVETLAKIGHYVYILVDPRNGEVFYVGKGSGNRIFEHEKENKYEKKNLKIFEIYDSGNEVEKHIIHSGLNNEKEAFSAETALYNLLKFQNAQLTNIKIPKGFLHECFSVDEYDRRHSGVLLTIDGFENISENLALLNLNKNSIKKNWLDEEIEAILSRFPFVLTKTPKITTTKDLPEVVFAIHNCIIRNSYDVKTWESRERPWHIGKTVTEYRIAKATINKTLNEAYKGGNVSNLIYKSDKSAEWSVKMF